MKEMTSLDLKHLIDELDFLQGARVDKIYHYDRELRIKLYVPQMGNFALLIGPGKMYITDKNEEMPDASNFAMFLRKHLKGKKLEALEQYKFDRVAGLKIGEHILIAEFFHKGNFILCDENYKILMPMEFQRWKDRELISKKDYIFPKSTDIRKKEDFELAANNDQKIEAFLHTNGFGLYAKEILLTSKVENKKCSELSNDEKSRVHAAMTRLLSAQRDPQVILKEIPVDAVPFAMEIYKGEKKKKFESFSKALDYYYEKTEKKEDRQEGKKEAVVKKQHEAVEKMEKEEKELERKIMLINNRYAAIEYLLNSIKEAKKKHNWGEVKNKFENEIQNIDTKKGVIVLRLHDQLIDFKVNTNLRKTLNDMYSRIKKIKRKKESAARHIGKALIKEEKKSRPKGEQKMWYHKYRHFITSEGFLVVAGKDEQTNENLVKKHTMPSDIVLHAEITGAPFTVIKTDKEVSDQAIKEAAIFAACYSKAWPMGLGSVDVYWVKPEQVSKDAPSGEYLRKGSFVIKGRKNYIRNVELRICVGITEEGNLITAPHDSIIRNAKYYVTLFPGDNKEIGKKVKRKLETMLPAVLKERLKSIKPGEIESRIPSRKGEIMQR